jgi:hypothetical protein
MSRTIVSDEGETHWGWRRAALDRRELLLGVLALFGT